MEARSTETSKLNYADLVILTTEGKYTDGYANEVQRVANQGDEKLGIEPTFSPGWARGSSSDR